MPISVHCCLHWLLCSIQWQEKELSWIHALARKHLLCCIPTLCWIHELCSLWRFEAWNPIHESTLDHLLLYFFGNHFCLHCWPLRFQDIWHIHSQRNWRHSNIRQVLEAKPRLRLTSNSRSILRRHTRIWEAVKVLQAVKLWQMCSKLKVKAWNTFPESEENDRGHRERDWSRKKETQDLMIDDV